MVVSKLYAACLTVIITSLAYGQPVGGFTEVTIFPKSDGSTGPNVTHVGDDYIYSVKNGTPGLTNWALGVNLSASPHGLLRLSDGSGAGGFDGNGAQIYCTAINGECQALQFTANQNGIITNIGSSDTFPNIQGINLQSSSLSGNKMFIGYDYISVRNGTAVISQLGQTSNKGRLRLSDGTGSGGLDGAGAQIFADGLTSVVQARGGMAVVVPVGSSNLFNRFQAIDDNSNPNGGFYGSQMLAYQDHVYAQLGSTLGSVSGLKLYPDTPGNSVNAGIDFINSLAGDVTGHTIWALGQSGNYGLLRLSSGAGSGGWDGNGATILGTASDGQLQATLFTSHGSGTSYTFQTSSGSFLVNGNGDIYSGDTAFNTIQSPNGGMLAKQFVAIQSSVATQIGAITGSVTGIQIYPSSGFGTGNQMNCGIDFCDALENGTTGRTIWALGQSGNNGLLRISNGTGSGGWDGNGAQIFGTASDGQLQATLFNSHATGTSTAFQTSGGTFTLNGAGALYSANTAFNAIQVPSGGVYALQMLTLQDGVYTQIGSTLGTVTGLQIYPSGAGNHVNAGIDFINSLSGGTAGHTLWALAQSSGRGILRVSDGSGSGGLDGNGAYIYGDGSQLHATTLNMTGGNIFAPSGSGGLTGTLSPRNGANTGSCTITISGGLITASTC